MSKSTKPISDIIFIKDDSRVRVEFNDGIPAYFSVGYFENACKRIGKSIHQVIANPDGFALRGEFAKNAKGSTWENEESGDSGEYQETAYSCNQLRVVLSASGALHSAVASEAAQALAAMLGAGNAPVAPTLSEENSEEKEEETVTEPEISEEVPTIEAEVPAK